MGDHYIGAAQIQGVEADNGCYRYTCVYNGTTATHGLRQTPPVDITSFYIAWLLQAGENVPLMIIDMHPGSQKAGQRCAVQWYSHGGRCMMGVKGQCGAHTRIAQTC